MLELNKNKTLRILVSLFSSILNIIRKEAAGYLGALFCYLYQLPLHLAAIVQTVVIHEVVES